MKPNNQPKPQLDSNTHLDHLAPDSAVRTKLNLSRRNWRKILFSAAFIAAGSTFVSHPSEMAQTGHRLEKDANIAYEVLPFTEGCAWAGAIMMTISAGKKIKNPFTVKSRLAEIKDDLTDNRMFRGGWALGAAGAIGTSATIMGSALATLPENSWPLAGSVALASLTFSTIPFRPNRKNKD